MEDFISVKEVLSIFCKFCSQEISACGSSEEECMTCLFYKKFESILTEKQ